MLPYPIAIVNNNGELQFCNAQFDKLLKERLNIKNAPTSILKLTG